MDDSDAVPTTVYREHCHTKVTKQEQKAVRPLSCPDEEYVYNFTHKSRGIAVIIINDKVMGQGERRGCERDKSNLQNLFTHMGFDIRTFHEKSKEDLMVALDQIAKEDHTDSDCIAVAISSHGEETVNAGVKEECICTTNGYVRVADILEKFNDTNCPTLTNKPRLFFIQACRGRKLDSGISLKLKSPKSLPGINAQQGSGSVPQPSGRVPSRISQPQDSTDALPVSVKHHQLKQTQPQQTLPASFTSRSTGGNVISQEETTGSALVTQEETGSPLVTQEETTGTPLVTQEETTGSAFEALDTMKTTPAPCQKDYLVMCAAPPGHYAFRNESAGSWFITCLHDVLVSAEKEQTLMKDLTRVCGKMAHFKESYSKNPAHSRKKQIPVIYTMLTRDVILRPKENQYK